MATVEAAAARGKTGNSRGAPQKPADTEQSPLSRSRHPRITEPLLRPHPSCCSPAVCVLSLYRLCVAMTEGALARPDVDRTAAQSRANAHLAAAVAHHRENAMNARDTTHTRHLPSSSTLDRTLRIRGLPFGATTDDVIEFFRPLRLSSSSPVLCVPLEQRPPGEAYVRFKNREDAERGMRRHRAMMQRRFIEVFHVVDQKEIGRC